MTGTTRGHQARTSVLAGIIVAAGLACASNPPPAPTRSLSVRGVFDCGLSVMSGSGWELASPPGGPRIGEGHAPQEPEYLIALLQRGDSQINQINLTVRRTDRGAITVEVGRGHSMPLLAEGERLEQQIAARCMS